MFFMGCEIKENPFFGRDITKRLSLNPETDSWHTFGVVGSKLSPSRILGLSFATLHHHIENVLELYVVYAIYMTP